jgi:hypothetical protein
MSGCEGFNQNNWLFSYENITNPSGANWSVAVVFLRYLNFWEAKQLTEFNKKQAQKLHISY